MTSRLPSSRLEHTCAGTSGVSNILLPSLQHSQSNQTNQINQIKSIKQANKLNTCNPHSTPMQSQSQPTKPNPAQLYRALIRSGSAKHE